MSGYVVVSTSNRFHLYAVDSSGAAVSGADLRIYIHNYTSNLWLVAGIWQGTRNYNSMTEDANIAGYYYYDVTAPSTDQVGLNIYAESATGTVANGPWDENVWVVTDLASTTTSTSTTVSGISPILLRLEGYLKRIEQLANQIFRLRK